MTARQSGVGVTCTHGTGSGASDSTGDGRQGSDSPPDPDPDPAPDPDPDPPPDDPVPAGESDVPDPPVEVESVWLPLTAPIVADDGATGLRWPQAESAIVNASTSAYFIGPPLSVSLGGQRARSMSVLFAQPRAHWDYGDAAHASSQNFNARFAEPARSQV